ncbi:MAG TPA: FAD-dependent oxidoreductase [Solirubrobacteraceae bacterium]|nr:FAD-dependent oxidoreductase [Solirubrobacteraceae bacterium]
MSEGSASRCTAARVAIAGGGFAALESALALRALAEDKVELTLISPSGTFAYRPAATAAVFGAAQPVSYDLRQIAADIGARYQGFALEAISPAAQRLRLASGLTLDYDALILATGARAVAAVPGALTFRDERDIPRLSAVLDQLGTHALRRLVFAVPSARTWALPVYELALMSAHHATSHGACTQIVIATPERTPLAIFGDAPSSAVAELLLEREIQFVGGVIPHSVGRGGSLSLQFGGSVKADQVVALSELHATRIAGIPASWSGFIPTDPYGRVEGLANVFAAGDVTTFPVKQGGIAAQQADRVAHTIAAGIGAPVKALHGPTVLRARLLTGDGALVLRTELDALGRPVAGSIQHRESRQAEDLKVFGRYVTPYLSLHGARLRDAGVAA